MYNIYCFMLRKQGDAKLPPELRLMVADKALKSGIWSISSSSGKSRRSSHEWTRRLPSLLSVMDLCMRICTQEAQFISLPNRTIEERLVYNPMCSQILRISLIEWDQKVWTDCARAERLSRSMRVRV